MFFAQKKRRTEEEAFSGGGQEKHPREGLVRLPIDAVYPNPDQPRRIFDEAALNELAHSIAQYGLIQPVVVRWREDRYELIAGERRWRACKRAGFTQIDAVISEADEVQGACMALV